MVAREPPYERWPSIPVPFLGLDDLEERLHKSPAPRFSDGDIEAFIVPDHDRNVATLLFRPEDQVSPAKVGKIRRVADLLAECLGLRNAITGARDSRGDARCLDGCGAVETAAPLAPPVLDAGVPVPEPAALLHEVRRSIFYRLQAPPEDPAESGNLAHDSFRGPHLRGDVYERVEEKRTDHPFLEIRLAVNGGAELSNAVRRRLSFPFLEAGELEVTRIGIKLGNDLRPSRLERLYGNELAVKRLCFEIIP